MFYFVISIADTILFYIVISTIITMKIVTIISIIITWRIVNRHYYQTLPSRKWTTGASVDASLNMKSLFNRTSRYASRYQTYLIFHHQQQGRIEFITVNTHQPTGKDFLIHVLKGSKACVHLHMLVFSFASL